MVTEVFNVDHREMLADFAIFVDFLVKSVKSGRKDLDKIKGKMLFLLFTEKVEKSCFDFGFMGEGSASDADCD